MFDKNIIESEIEKIKSNGNYKKVSYIPTDYLFKYYKDEYIITVFKIHDKFKYELNKHLIDLNQLYNISKALYNKLAVLNEFKTKNKDKLLVYCPRNVGEYCPICSFNNALNSISNIKLLEEFEENNKTKLAIIRLCSNLTKVFSKLPNYYIPSIILNTGTGIANLLFLSCNYNDLKYISEALSNKLEENNMSIEDLDNFSMNMIISENIKKIDIIDINLSNNNIANIISNLVNDMENKYNLGEDNIKYLISGDDIDNINKIQIIFDKIADEFCENILELLNQS